MISVTCDLSANKRHEMYVYFKPHKGYEEMKTAVEKLKKSTY